MKVHIGTSGWNYAHWKGGFYPKDLPSGGWLEFYSHQFKTVEINNTFYRWPSVKTINNWYYLAPDNFLFTLKAPRTITHVRRLVNVGDHLKTFYGLTDHLKEKLACHLFQLPPSFAYNENNLYRLEYFLKQLDVSRLNAIEFRHPSWWREDVYALCKKRKAIFCTVSGLGMPDDFIVTHKVVYVRLHGTRYSSRYSLNELKSCARKIKESKKTAFVYFNNDVNAYAVTNAQELSDLLS